MHGFNHKKKQPKTIKTVFKWYQMHCDLKRESLRKNIRSLHELMLLL